MLMNDYTTMEYSDLIDSSEVYTTQLNGEVAGAIGAGLVIFALVFAILSYVFISVTLGKIFKKAGIPSWIAWVPFYNTWKMFEMGSFHGALSLLVLVPVFGQLAFTVLYYIAAYRIGLKFGKSSEFVILAIFLPPVWLGILGFGKAQWNGKIGGSDSPTNPQPPIQPPYQPMRPIQPEQPEQTMQPVEPQPPIQSEQQPPSFESEQPEQPQPPVQPNL
jgi:hypothetical protein